MVYNVSKRETVWSSFDTSDFQINYSCISINSHQLICYCRNLSSWQKHNEAAKEKAKAAAVSAVKSATSVESETPSAAAADSNTDVTKPGTTAATGESSSTDKLEVCGNETG